MTQLEADPFHTIAESAEIVDGVVLPYYLSDRRLRISIARVAGSLYAFAGLCTCTDQPCPLSGGLLAGTTLMCQCHGSRFDIATGAVLSGPATAPLNIYEVLDVNGEIRIRG